MHKNILLVKPDIKYLEEIKFYKNEYIDNNDVFHGISFLEKFSSIGEWIKYTELLKKEETLPNDNSIVRFFFLLVDESTQKVLGDVNLRPELTDYGFKYVGHVGYAIAPSERKNGYGKEILRLTLLKAKELGLNKILVTCRDDNIGSSKIIEANGGVLENKLYSEDEKEWIRRYWIDIT